MASYRLVIKTSAVKEIEALPRKDRGRVVARIRRLANEPRPAGVEKLSGDDKYRIRQRDYRILFAVEDTELTVTIVKIGHRREVYRA